jgi:peroxiredoxin
MLIKKTILLAILAVAILVLAGCGGSQQSSQIASLAPEFELKNTAGDSITLSSLKGKLVLINFWATTCPPCLEEMPQFEALQKDWAQRGDVKLLMIDAGESAATVRNYLKDRGFTFTVLLDDKFEVGKKFNIRYTPTTLIIDKDGILRASIVGPFKNKAAIEKQVAPYLSK